MIAVTRLSNEVFNIIRICSNLSSPPLFLSGKMCFRTTVYDCNSSYYLHLKRRNVTNLHRRCPSEDPSGRLSHTSSSVFFNSPQYMCRNKRGRLLKYRKKEFCLYNVSVSDCPSGMVEVKLTSGEQSLHSSAECGQDYIQFYAGSFRSRRFCGRDLGLGERRERLLLIPSTQFLAVFWTSHADHATGFSLVASCKG